MGTHSTMRNSSSPEWLARDKAHCVMLWRKVNVLLSRVEDESLAELNDISELILNSYNEWHYLVSLCLVKVIILECARWEAYWGGILVLEGHGLVLQVWLGTMRIWIIRPFPDRHSRIHDTEYLETGQTCAF